MDRTSLQGDPDVFLYSGTSVNAIARDTNTDTDGKHKIEYHIDWSAQGRSFDSLDI